MEPNTVLFLVMAIIVLIFVVLVVKGAYTPVAVFIIVLKKHNGVYVNQIIGSTTDLKCVDEIIDIYYKKINCNYILRELEPNFMVNEIRLIECEDFTGNNTFEDIISVISLNVNYIQ
jgi:hypothetical protein